MNPQERQKLIAELQQEERDANAGRLGPRGEKLSPKQQAQRLFVDYLKRTNPKRGDEAPSAAEQKLFDLWIHHAMLDQAMRDGLGAVPLALSLDELHEVATGEKEDDEDLEQLTAPNK